MVSCPAKPTVQCLFMFLIFYYIADEMSEGGFNDCGLGEGITSTSHSQIYNSKQTILCSIVQLVSYQHAYFQV